MNETKKGKSKKIFNRSEKFRILLFTFMKLIIGKKRKNSNHKAFCFHFIHNWTRFLQTSSRLARSNAIEQHYSLSAITLKPINGARHSNYLMSSVGKALIGDRTVNDVVREN